MSNPYKETIGVRISKFEWQSSTIEMHIIYTPMVQTSVLFIRIKTSYQSMNNINIKGRGGGVPS